MKHVAVTLLLLTLLGSSRVRATDAREEAFRLNEVGIAALREGDHERAIESFLQARKLLPDAPTLRKNLAAARSSYGVWLSREGDLEGAVRQLRAAVALEPESALYRLNLGTLYHRVNRLGEAEEELARAVHLDGANGSARVALGRVLYKRGELERAIREWEAALSQEPDRREVAEELEKARREFAAERNHTREETLHFRISWDGTEDRSVGSRVSRILEDAYEKVGRELGIFPSRPVRVVLYGEKEFRIVTGAEDWVGGLFDGTSIRVPVGNFLEAEEEIREKLFHEYTHVAVRSVTERCPTWLNEGLAQHFEERDPRAAQVMVLRAKQKGVLLTLKELSSPYTRIREAVVARLAYAQALLLTGFVLDEHGPEPIRRFLAALGEGLSPGEAATRAFRRTLEEIDASWRESL
jgi:tetratricopeptide (TPR) repeat protein